MSFMHIYRMLVCRLHISQEKSLPVNFDVIFAIWRLHEQCHVMRMKSIKKMLHLNDRIWDRGHALIIRLCDDRKTLLICADECSKVGQHVERCELISICDLQSLCKGRQTIIAEAQGLSCMTIKSLFQQLEVNFTSICSNQHRVWSLLPL